MNTTPDKAETAMELTERGEALSRLLEYCDDHEDEEAAVLLLELVEAYVKEEDASEA